VPSEAAQDGSDEFPVGRVGLHDLAVLYGITVTVIVPLTGFEPGAVAVNVRTYEPTGTPGPTLTVAIVEV
jgi:hypothetical protein